MTVKDLSNDIAVITSLAPAARTSSANGTGVDLAQFRAAAVVFVVGAITDGTHTPTIEESDSSGSGFTTVAAGDLSVAPVALVASTNQEISYLGTKRYIRAVSTITGSPSTGGVYSAVVVKGHPFTKPA